MVSKRNMAGLLIPLLISGCAVRPDYRRPSSDLPGKYVTIATGHTDAYAVQNTNLSTWWINFNDSILPHLIEEAPGQILELSQARACISQAKAGPGYTAASILASDNTAVQGSRNYQPTETSVGQLFTNCPNFDRYCNVHTRQLAESLKNSEEAFTVARVRPVHFIKSEPTV